MAHHIATKPPSHVALAHVERTLAAAQQYDRVQLYTNLVNRDFIHALTGFLPLALDRQRVVAQLTRMRQDNPLGLSAAMLAGLLRAYYVELARERVSVEYVNRIAAPERLNDAAHALRRWDAWELYVFETRLTPHCHYPPKFPEREPRRITHADVVAHTVLVKFASTRTQRAQCWTCSSAAVVASIEALVRDWYGRCAIERGGGGVGRADDDNMNWLQLMESLSQHLPAVLVDASPLITLRAVIYPYTVPSQAQELVFDPVLDDYTLAKEPPPLTREAAWFTDELLVRDEDNAPCQFRLIPDHTLASA